MADDQSLESMLSPLAALRARLPDQPKLTPDEMRAASNFAAPTGPAPTLRPSTGPHRTLGERLGQNATNAVQTSPTGAAMLGALIQTLKASGPDVYGKNPGQDLAGAVKRSNEQYEAQSQADPFYSAPGGMFDKTLAGGATLAGNLVGLGDPLFAAATPLTEGAAAANAGKKTLAQLAKEFAARSGKMGALNAGADTATQLAQLAGGTRDKYDPTQTGEAFAMGPAFEVGKEALVGGARGLLSLLKPGDRKLLDTMRLSADDTLKAKGQSDDTRRDAGELSSTEAGRAPGKPGTAPGTMAQDGGPQFGADGRSGAPRPPLPGHPGTFTVGGVPRTILPHEPARIAAESYKAQRGLTTPSPSEYVPLDKDRGVRIAQAYGAMEDNPRDPKVQRAYSALANETLAQWEAMKRSGITVEFNPPNEYPYELPHDALDDISRNNHLFIFPTDEGYGESPITAEAEAINPMLQIVPGETWNGRPVRVNDIFRAVHDYFGHASEGSVFRAQGEENAFRSHLHMFSPDAQRALATETRGQNSFVNFGPEAAANKGASQAETRYAPQKIGLLPDWAVFEGTDFDPARGSRKAAGADRAPASAQDMQGHVDRLTESWKSGTKAKVVASEDQLPPEVAAQLKRDGMSGKTGALVGPDGKVYLIADQIGSPENATSALYHETLGHLGLNAKYGEQLDQALGRIYQSSPTVQREAEEWLRAHPEAYPDDPNKQMRAVEEVLAAKAENGVLDASIKSQLTAMIRQFGRMMGMNLEMSDKELAAILRSAQRKITHGQGTADGAGANRYIFVGQKAYENLKKQDPRKLFPENQNLIANWEEGQRMMAQGFTPEQIFDKTGVFINPSDQMPRYELSDVPAVLNQDFRTWQLGQEAPLNQMLTHPTLMQAYPDKVKQWTIGRSDNPDYSGSFDANKNRIEITDKSQDPRSTALHEIQHGIQFHEGFDTGNNPESVLASATPEQVERYATELLPAFERKAQGAEIDAMIIREMKDDPRMIEYLQLNSMKAASLRAGVPLAQLAPLEAQIKASEGPALQAVYDATQDQSRANDEWRKISSTVLGNAIKRIETTPNDIFFGPLSKANIEAEKYQQVVDDIKSKDKWGMRDAIAWGDTVPEAASMRLRMYKNVSGEMESRDVEARKNLPEYALRTIRPLSTTNDTALVKPEDVIRTQRKGMSNPAIEGGLSDRDRELAGLMASVEDGNKHGVEPSLRVEVPNPPPPGTKAKFTQTTNNKNAPKQLENITPVLEAHPDATKSTDAWENMMGDALGFSEVPIPPYAFIRDINGQGSIEKLQTLKPGQIADADHGFEQAKLFRQKYEAGEMSIGTTGELLMWSFLSRGVSPYAQEGLFIDSIDGIEPFIRMAADGNFTKDQFPAYEEWVKQQAPKGSGQPGAGAIHNLGAYGRDFLYKMGQEGEDGVTHLQRLHDMLSDPKMTGKQIRREFAKFSEGVGIDNKVMSFTLLVAGHPDVMVLDRVQIRQLWDDGRFGDRNLYDGRKDENGKQVAGTRLSDLTYGARGILVYEAIERGIEEQLPRIYGALGRPEDASVGRYHWETWVADSGQEASHGTLTGILNKAQRKNAPMADIRAKQGEYGAYEYGAEYGRDHEGIPYYRYKLPSGDFVEFSVPAYRRFMEDIKKQGKKVVPKDFKVTESGNAPWYERPQVNKERLEILARLYADRAIRE